MGLFMYFLRDEPSAGALKTIGRVATFIRALDPYHPCYVNHFPPVALFGTESVEHFYAQVFEHLDPEFLSYDHYPICIASGEELDGGGGQPWLFPEGKVRVKPDFYQALDLFRGMSLARGLPFWAFTNAVRQAAVLVPRESRAVALTFKQGKMVVESSSPESGDARVEMPVKYEGEAITIHFNPDYLLDGTKAMNNEVVTLEMKDSSRAAVMRAGPDYLYLIMPISQD